jgi:hypothetical protein
MGLFSKPQKQDFPDLPDNLYIAKLAKIANKVGKTSGKPYTSWGFEIVQPPFSKRWVWANTQPTVSPKSQTGKFLTVLGVDISTVDENFNEQLLIGKYIKVLVETSENEDTGDKFQNVTKLMALTDADLQLLQIWLTQANVKGPIQVAAQAQPVFQQPVLAAAPVSFPLAPVAAPAPVVAPIQQPVVVQPVVAAPVAAPAPAAPKRTSTFPF